MNSIRLRKKIKDDVLYFLVYDQEKDVYYDWFTFENYKDLPVLEKFFFKLMQDELVEQFENTNYSKLKYQTNLLILYNISFNGDLIDITSSSILSDFYVFLKYRELNEKIASFNKQICVSSVDLLKKEILKTPISSMSSKGKELFKKLCLSCGISDEKELFKEMITLTISNEYNKAIHRVIKQEELVKNVKKILIEEKIYSDTDS